MAIRDAPHPERSAQRAVEGRTVDAEVLICGGGPVGLGLAIELGLRGVPVILVELRDGTISVPKMSNVHIRSMEFCRRWGIADRVIAAGWPHHLPLDLIYVTTMAGYELGRHRIPSYDVEPNHPHSPVRDRHCPQLYFDPILRDFASTLPPVSLRYYTRLEDFEVREDGVAATVADVRTGEKSRISARYLVGCDGAQSLVRERLGIGVGGAGRLDRSVTVYIRSPELARMHDKGWGRMYRFVDETGCWSEMIAIDGKELYRLTVLSGLDPDNFDAHGCIRRAMGAPFEYEIFSVLRWDRLEFVADSYRRGRVFLAGDSAHQNSPTGGLGMNTGLADAVDLGWKLAAVAEGWGGEGLLQSYETERRPVALRNTQFCSELFYETIAVPGSPELEAKSAAGEAARALAGASITEITPNNRMSGSLALRIGYCYENSPVIAEESLPPVDYRAPFRPSARPGARAPHAWLADGRSILDLYGNGFTLLRLGGKAPDGAALAEAAKRRGVPLTAVALDDEKIAALYGAGLVLVRPDGHVAWRGADVPADPLALIDRVRGAA